MVAFGWNEHGMCGTGDEVNVTHPHVVEGEVGGWDMVRVGAGAGHSLAVVKRPL